MDKNPPAFIRSWNCGLHNEVVSISFVIAPSDGRMRYHFVICPKDWGKQRKSLVKVIIILADIRAEYLLNKSQNYYSLSHIVYWSLEGIHFVYQSVAVGKPPAACSTAGCTISTARNVQQWTIFSEEWVTILLLISPELATYVSCAYACKIGVMMSSIELLYAGTDCNFLRGI